MPEELQKRSLWLGLIERAITVLVALAIGAFFLGGARQKVSQKVTTLENEMAAWREEWKAEHKHIVEMDLNGSVATKNFVHQYDKDQKEQNQTIKEIQAEVRHLELMKAQIDRIARKVDDGKP